MSVTIDVATLDLIENALLNARFEMDEVVRRAAMSPTIRVQHDEFPMICNARGQMVVGQFGSYIPEVIDRFGGEIVEGDVILLNDPYLCKGSISHCNDWLVILPVFYEGEHVAFALALRPHDGRGREGARQPGLGRALDLGGGHPDPADQDLRPRRPQRDGARRDPQQHAHAGHEPERPDGDHRGLPRGGAADRRDLRALRPGDVRGRVRRAARADTAGDGAHHPHVHPGGARRRSPTGSTTTASATARSRWC